MPNKTIVQIPVSIAHLPQVVFILFETGGGVDGVTSYRPVDETGTPVGEVRSFTINATGPTAQRWRDFLTAEIVPALNAEEGTA